jgi:MFS family permease
MDSQLPKTGGLPALRQYLSATFTSLRHRSFKFYCLGVIVSLTGSLMQETVVAWLGYQMTGSSFVLGSILFSYQLPMLALGVLGGYAADRLDRLKIIRATQALALLISLTWLTLSATGLLQVWHLYALSATFGVVVAFEIPARFAMIPQLVEGKDCMNAFSLDSLLFYSGRVFGPALGALALAAFGATACFALNSVSYVIELVTLAFIVPTAYNSAGTPRLREAFAATYGNPRVRRLLGFVAVFSFCGVYIPLMPVFTALLKGNASTNGMLIAASEVGAIVGSLFLANRTSNVVYLGTLARTVGLAGISYAVCLALFSMSTSLPLSLALIIPTGLSMTLVLIGSHALVQSQVEDRMRGVVSTVFWMYSYFGMFALGGPTLGWFVDRSGVAATMFGAALVCIASALYYLRLHKATLERGA